MRKITLAEKHALRKAKKDYKLSKTTDGHEAGRQKVLKGIFDGIRYAEKNWGGLKITQL